MRVENTACCNLSHDRDIEPWIDRRRVRIRERAIRGILQSCCMSRAGTSDPARAGHVAMLDERVVDWVVSRYVFEQEGEPAG